MRTAPEDQEKKTKKKSDQQGGNGRCFSKVDVNRKFTEKSEEFLMVLIPGVLFSRWEVGRGG